MEQNQCTSCGRPIPAGVAQCPHCGATLAAAPPTYAAAPHRGAMILAFGIFGLICCAPLGIVAWVMGNGDLAEMAAGRMDRSGSGMTQAGKICGIVAVVLWVIGAVISIMLFALGRAMPFMQ